MYDGIICDSSVQVRRVSFYNAKPYGEFRSQKAYVTNIDSSGVGSAPLSGDALDTYIASPGSWDDVDFKPTSNPDESWTFPLVTGSSY